MKQLLTMASIILLITACETKSEAETKVVKTPDDLLLSEQPEPEVEPEKKEFLLEKELVYDKHTLDDVYPYKDTVRTFQWEKIESCLKHTDMLAGIEHDNWGIIQNKRNAQGLPPLPHTYHTNEYNVATDKWGVDRSQAAPLYSKSDLKTPERYGYDGTLVRILDAKDDFLLVRGCNFEGEYYIPENYIHLIEDTLHFNKSIVIDRHNQNIATFEKTGDVWKVRSMNPCTTGAHKPPHQKPTPLGIFVIQNKLPKMYYYVDGTTTIGGYAPWASRFCEGAYMHGVPVNLPRTEMIEFSQTLGTTPRSHMCVRNATSHAKYIYDNFPAEQTLVYVIE